MPVYHTRTTAEAYGRAVGFLLPDVRVPYIPGDPGNAGTHRFPVLYRVVPGLGFEGCTAHSAAAETAILAAARYLAEQGVRGIATAGACMLPYQAAVRSALSLPVMLSPLLQLPLLASSLHVSRPIGILAADDDPAPAALLAQLGLTVPNRLVVAGMSNAAAFSRAILHQAGRLDSDRLETETVQAATGLMSAHPDIGAIILAAPVLSPYAAAVQRATGIVIADAVTACRLLYSATHQRAYSGAY